MDLAAELGRVNLFKPLNPQDLMLVGAVGRECTLNNGQVLFREGEVGDEAFAIVLGTVRLDKNSDQGGCEELSILGSGSYIGEVGLVSPDHRHGFTATAMEKTVVVGFRQSDIDSIAEKDPRVGCDIYKALSLGFARRLVSIAAEAAHFKSTALHHGE